MTLPPVIPLSVICEDPGVYRTLLESTKAIPWRIDWATMRFTYIGPQIEELLGWSQASWLTVDDWANRIHEEDRQKTVEFCVAQSQKGVDHEADYRAITYQGDHVWIRDVVHVVRRPYGSVESLVGFMFDISARKEAEDKIVQLQRELELLSYRDSLNRCRQQAHVRHSLSHRVGKSARKRPPAVSRDHRYRLLQAVQRSLWPRAR